MYMKVGARTDTVLDYYFVMSAIIESTRERAHKSTGELPHLDAIYPASQVDMGTKKRIVPQIRGTLGSMGSS